MTKSTSKPTIIQVRSRKTLLAQGHTPSELQTRVRKGEWRRIYSGTFVRAADIDHLRVESKYRIRALAVAARSPQLVLSHISAVAAHGLPLFGADLSQVHLTRNARNGASRTLTRVVHAKKLDDCDVSKVNEAAVTSVARSLVDYARTSHLDSAVVAIDFALRAGVVSLAELGVVMTKMSRSKGAPKARRAISASDGRSESPGESRARLILMDASLPPVESQVHILDSSGNELGRVDLGYPELGVLIEFDGREKYVKYLRPGQTPAEAVEAERRRENRIRELGYIVIRIVWSELDDPAMIRARVRQALALARKRLEIGGCAGSFWVEQRVG